MEGAFALGVPTEAFLGDGVVGVNDPTAHNPERKGQRAGNKPETKETYPAYARRVRLGSTFGPVRIATVFLDNVLALLFGYGHQQAVKLDHELGPNPLQRGAARGLVPRVRETGSHAPSEGEG